MTTVPRTKRLRLPLACHLDCSLVRLCLKRAVPQGCSHDWMEPGAWQSSSTTCLPEQELVGMLQPKDAQQIFMKACCPAIAWL